MLLKLSERKKHVNEKDIKHEWGEGKKKIKRYWVGRKRSVTDQMKVKILEMEIKIKDKSGENRMVVLEEEGKGSLLIFL